MKATIYFIFSFFLLFSAIHFTASADSDPTKYALIIAVADYPEEGRWPDISSDNDISLIEGALLRQGFDKENMKVIVDDQAGKDLIVQEFKTLAGNVSPGDIVVIHYSGHGQQIQDDGNDEMDGYDEAIIPWDAQLRWSETYQGEKHLRDDEIKILTDEIREQLGPEGNVLLILDACHSGTASRSAELGVKTRGTEVIFSEPGYKPSSNKGNNEDRSDIDPEKLAPMVTLSGASQHQLNYEYYDREKDTSYGSLSYAFSKAMNDADQETTYRVLFDRIKVNMSTIAPRQSPQVEGEVDMEIFGGEVIEPKPYYLVTGYWDVKSVTINAGNLMGIYDSSEVAFYPLGTYKPEESEPIATGIIAYTTAVESDVVLSEPMDEETIRNTWVYITKQNYGDNDLNVKVDISNDKVFEDIVIAKLSDMPKINIVENNPDLILEMNNEHTRGNRLQLITIDETELFASEVNNENEYKDVISDIVGSINSFMQVNLLKKIEMKDPDIDVTFEIVPVDLNTKVRPPEILHVYNSEEFRSEGDVLEFPDGHFFQIKVKNNGNTRAFYQIINIKPNNELFILLPSTNPRDKRTPEEFVVDVGEGITLPYDFFFFEPPYGNEYLKLIATREPIDLRMIIKSRGGSSRGPANTPFEDLLKNSYSGTRAGYYSTPPSAATVYTLPFTIVKKPEVKKSE